MKEGVEETQLVVTLGPLHLILGDGEDCLLSLGLNLEGERFCDSGIKELFSLALERRDFRRLRL